MTLFNLSGAHFNSDKKYRYYLYRYFVERPKKLIMFIGLNPSTANETDDDPTIRRCISFAKNWGFDGMIMCNLYAYVSTDPSKLILDTKLEFNNAWLKYWERYVSAVVFAWGCFKQHKKRMDEVIKMFPDAYCIDISKDGYPKHPLYLSSKLKLKEFKQSQPE